MAVLPALTGFSIKSSWSSLLSKHIDPTESTSKLVIVVVRNKESVGRLTPKPPWYVVLMLAVGAGILGGLFGGLAVIVGFAGPLVVAIVVGLILFGAGALFWMGMKTRQFQRQSR